MSNNFVPRLILILIIFLSLIQNISAEVNWSIPQEGNKIILIRHASAPGGGDPEGFDIKKCNTQRNLDNAGIEQSKNIGRIFKKKSIPIDKVLTSQWCRCKDTAKYAFNNYKEFSALNSTFQSPFDKNEKEQLIKIKEYVKNWQGNGRNLVMVTHYSIIIKLTNTFPSSGEIIIANKNFKVLEQISTF
jgi:phosphohistidine phosphatase SixA